MNNESAPFPDPVYRDTVLSPLFDGVKAHFSDAMAAINQAHLIMLDDARILDKSQVQAIAQALNDINSELNLSELEYTGEYEDYFFLVEAQLNDRLGADLGGMLHTARSRNDMDHTVFKMALRTRCDHLLVQSMTLATTIVQRINDDSSTAIVAYTHGQPAQPSTLAHYLSAVLEVLTADIQRILQARAALDLCPMGAAAITTSGFAIDRTQMASLLGFREPKRNSYGCIASVDYITGLYSAMKLMFLHLGRVVQDFAFWSAFEVGQLSIPDSLVQVSSIMPQKRNPVPIEHLRHLSSLTSARCDMMINTMHNTPFTDMNDSEGEVQVAGYAAFDSGNRVLSLLNVLLGSIKINSAAVSRNANAACITITELADTLVREEKLSFRQAHGIAAATARAVIANEQVLCDGYEAFQTAFEDMQGRASHLDHAQFQQVISIEYFIEVRDRFGGPGRASMQDAISFYRQSLEQLGSEIAMGPERIAAADARRHLAFNALSGD